MRAVLVREPLEAAVPAARAALILRGEDRPFALIGAWAGGGALLGSRPVRVSGPGDDLFALLDEQPDVAGGDGAAVGGGWVGFLGFEARHRVEPGQPPPPRPVPLPDGALSFYDHVVRMDAAGRWWFEALVTPAREAAILRRRDELAARLADPPAARPFSTRDWRWTPGPAGHAAAVEACRERIRAGDLFQANLCMRLQGRLDGDAFDLFAAAAAALPTDRAAFVAGPWGTVASLSPELFLTRSGRTVGSAPIKGTRPAGGRDELAASAKDRAENVMIVDLVRNDLGRVCRPGTVRVTALADVRPARRGLAHGLRGRGRAARGRGGRRPAARHVPARLGDRRAEARGARRDRRARVDRARGLHRGDRVREPAGRPGAERRDPHVRGPRPAHLARRRRRDRRRLARRRRGARGGRQGGAAAGGDRSGPARSAHLERDRPPSCSARPAARAAAGSRGGAVRDRAGGGRHAARARRASRPARREPAGALPAPRRPPTSRRASPPRRPGTTARGCGST